MTRDPRDLDLVIETVKAHGEHLIRLEMALLVLVADEGLLASSRAGIAAALNPEGGDA